MKSTQEVEKECNRMPLVLGYLKMRDHAKALESELCMSTQRIESRKAGKKCWRCRGDGFVKGCYPNMMPCPDCSLHNAGGMARELAAQDSESPTKQNG